MLLLASMVLILATPASVRAQQQTEPSVPGFPWPTAAEAYAEYPPYRQVVSALFRLAGREHIALPERWQLLKHPEGWVLQRRQVQQNQVDKDLRLVLWSREHMRFLNAVDLNLQSNPFRPFAFGEDADAMMRQAFGEWDRENAFYDLALFYGYPAAMRHSIAVLDGPQELEPDQLLALARAHAQEARRIINPDGLAAQAALEPLSQDSMDRADRHFRSATRLYAELAEREPEYPTIIGTASLEAPSANASAWMRWRLNGQDKRAAPYLAKARFHPFLEAAGYNMLTACRDSSILFTHGDVDTYLPLVVQQRDGYRTDVTIVSLSLLSLPAYRSQLAEGAWGPGLVALNSPPLDWASPEASRYTITERAMAPMDFPDALLAWSRGADTLPGLLADWCGLPEPLDLPLRWADASEWAELALLDAAHRRGRPVVYSMYAPQQRPFGGLFQHTVLEGLVHRFEWEPQRSAQEAGLQRLAEQAVDEYRFPQAEPALNKEPHAMSLIGAYRYMAAVTAADLAELGDTEAGLRLVNVLWRHLPEWVFPPVPADRATVALHYTHGSPERGAELAEALYKVLIRQPASGERDAILDGLEAHAREHEQEALLGRYAELRGGS